MAMTYRTQSGVLPDSMIRYGNCIILNISTEVAAMTTFVIQNRFTDEVRSIRGLYAEDAFIRWKLVRAEWFILDEF